MSESVRAAIARHGSDIGQQNPVAAAKLQIMRFTVQTFGVVLGWVGGGVPQ